MISGFMPIRNALRLGYPFREAIASAHAVVDELVVVDGYSEDGTYPILQELARTFPKIRLRQHPWDPVSINGSAFRNAANFARAAATGDYLLQLDASDVIPEEDVEPIRDLPRRFPRKELFGLPYIQLLGCIEFTSEMRWRFSRNLPSIRSIYDGWTMGYALRPVDLARPREWKRLLARAAVRLLQDHVAEDFPEQLVVLPRPIFHYYGMFPSAFLEKMGSKIFLQRNPRYAELTAKNPAVDRILEQYRSTGDWDAFWEEARAFTQELGARGPLNKVIDTHRRIPPELHPAIVRPQIGRAAYDPNAPLG